MTEKTPRKPVIINRCDDGKKCLSDRQKQFLSFIFMFAIIFPWNLARLNVSSYIDSRVADVIIDNVFEAVNYTVLFVIYFYFLYEVIKPANFSLKMNLIALGSMVAFTIFSILLVDSTMPGT